MENNDAPQPVSLAEPVLGREETQAVVDVLESGWITMGSKVVAFEKAFADLHHCPQALAVSTCTAALHLALRALGIGPRRKVLVPSMTFVATVAPVLYVGATPVFVDIVAPSIPHMDLEHAESLVDGDTAAVIIMHYGGYIIDVEPWRRFADKHGLALIEDAAHALAGKERWDVADAAVFSFFANKNITTAEGGILLAREQAVLDKARNLRGHAMTTGTLDRDKGHAFSYDVLDVGYNYRIDEIRAALGLAQLERLPQMQCKRKELLSLYRALLRNRGLERMLLFDDSWPCACHIMPVLLDEGQDREALMPRMRELGIQTSIHYPCVHKFTAYDGKYGGPPLPRTEAFARRELSLPLHPNLSREDVVRVVDGLLA